MSSIKPPSVASHVEREVEGKMAVQQNRETSLTLSRSGFTCTMELNALLPRCNSDALYKKSSDNRWRFNYIGSINPHQSHRMIYSLHDVTLRNTS